MTSNRREILQMFASATAAPRTADKQTSQEIRRTAVPITFYDGNVGADNYDATSALNAAMNSGSPVDLCGLSLQISAPLKMQTSIFGSDQNSSSISAIGSGFAGDTLLDPYYENGDLTFGRTVEGVSLTVSSDMSIIKSSSKGGGGGINRWLFDRVKFTSYSRRRYMLEAHSIQSEPGVFTGAQFESCSWFGPLPLHIGDNQDDICLICPRFHLHNATDVAQSPFFLSANNMTIISAFVEMREGYKIPYLFDLGSKNIQMEGIFLEGQHNFEYMFACTAPGADLNLSHVRLNTKYMGNSGEDCLLRVNVYNDVSPAKKRISLNGAVKISGQFPGPSFLVNAFIQQGSRSACDINLNINEEWNHLIVGGTGSGNDSEHSIRFHGYKGGKRIETSFQIRHDGNKVVALEAGLENIPKDYEIALAKENETIPVKATGFIQLSGAAPAGSTVELTSPLLLAGPSLGLKLAIRLADGNKGRVMLRSSQGIQAKIVFLSGSSARTIALGEIVYLEWNGREYKEF